MKLYTINNICVSATPISGTKEIEILTMYGANPSNYINKRITIFDGGYKVEVPPLEELINAQTQYKTLLKINSDILDLQDYILRLEYEKMEDGVI